MAAGWPSTSLDLCAPLKVSGLLLPPAPDTRDSTTANMLIVYTPSFSFPKRRVKKMKKRRRYFSNLYRVRHLRSSKFGIFHLLSILWRRLPASKYSHVCPHGKFCLLSFHLRITIEDDIATPLQCTVDTNRLSRAILSMRSAASDSLSIETNFAICTWCPGNAAQQFLCEYSLSGPLCGIFQSWRIQDSHKGEKGPKINDFNFTNFTQI